MSMEHRPSPSYTSEVHAFGGVVRKSTSVSQACAGIAAPTAAHFYASVLFTSLCTRAVSLCFLLPYSGWSKKNFEHWDYASISGIVRSILEVRLAFFYLGSEQCPEEEWQCRWNLFNLHDCTSRIRLFEELPDSQQDTDGFYEQAEELRDRLLNNAFFSALPANRKKKLLNGASAYLSPLEDIAVRAGVEIETFRLLYRWFSNQVHGLPMSFYRMGDQDRGRGVYSESEERWTLLCVSVARDLIEVSAQEMRNLFGLHD